MFFRKRPVIIEAVQFTGSNYTEIGEFCKNAPWKISDVTKNKIEIPTLEGIMTASAGDWIIKGIHGEFYPCKPDIFEKTYEAVRDTYEEVSWGD